MVDDRFTVLFVCHANICRSPMAERLARRAFAGGGTAVVSAGSHAWDGYAMHPFTAQVLAERGVDNRDFGSRRLTAPIVDSADLILTASRNQRAACATLSPAAARRTFTLRQFGRYAAALEPAALNPATHPLRGLLDRVSVVRGRLQPAPGEEDDLPDPVSGPVEGFRVCADEIQRHLDTMRRLTATT